MKIELREVCVRDVVNGYVDNDEEGVLGYGGRLNIRPPFQREFIYKDKQRNEVVRTIQKNFPLNIMYWVKSEDGNFELLDGQQRTISFCQYVINRFSLDGLYFHSLSKEKQDQILNYELKIYVCEGTNDEKLDWFKIINIAGEVLTNQELRNAVLTGTWLTDAKIHFSKTNCVAYKLASNYLNGSTIRQDYLETALKWISSRDEFTIEQYMSKHQHDANCDEVWLYFNDVIEWIQKIFPTYRGKLMKGLDWGIFYNKYGKNAYDPKEFENRIVELLDDEEITNQRGIYEYLLSGNEKHLNLRAFSDKIKRQVYEKQKGICPKCKAEGKNERYELDEMEADHITPWSEGGKTAIDNCQMLCRYHNRAKGSK